MASTDKYDRQLRLWGAHGQRALMGSKICLLNAGPTGAETLKNLVLPGCGYVCVVDGSVVTDADCANNFFVSRERLGQPRAQAVLELLLELNDDVAGSYVAEAPSSIRLLRPDFFREFSIVIASQLPLAELRLLAAVLAPHCIPLLAVRTYGLLGLVRLWSPEHRIVELKPQDSLLDLRVTHPWPALRSFADGIDLAACDDMTHRHVPYVALLLKALDAWRAAHGGACPSTFADKRAFREALTGMSRGPHPGDEANFEEAARAAYAAAAGAAADVAEGALSVLRDPSADASALTPVSDRFWFLAAALRGFYEAHGGLLPLAGDLPDMTATTDLYIALQRLYRAKAAEDAAEVCERVTALAAAAGAPAAVVADEAYVREGCRNARFLRVLRLHCLEGEAALDDITRGTLEEELQSAVDLGAAEQAPAVWYIALRAADRFLEVHGRVPGADDGTLEADAGEVHRLGGELLAAAGLPEALQALFTVKHAQEIVRYGGCEPQTVAALIGGVAAQEAVKLLTHQYLPLDNTYIFNGINGTAAALRV